MQLTQIAKILGGEKIIGKKLENKMDLVELGHIGVTKNAILHLASYLCLSYRQVAGLLPVTERTLQRYTLQQHFNTVVSEQVIHIAEVLAKGNDIFQGKKKFLLWLNAPHKVFAGNTPLTMLSSHFGAELVLAELGRIEFGVFS